MLSGSSLSRSAGVTRRQRSYNGHHHAFHTSIHVEIAETAWAFIEAAEDESSRLNAGCCWRPWELPPVGVHAV